MSVIENADYHAKEIPKAGEVNLWLVRHGQSQVYTDSDAALSDTGKAQVHNFGNKFITALREPTNLEQMVKIFYSSRLRTRQTAHVIHEQVERAIRNNLLDGVKLFSPHVLQRLQTADALAPIINTVINPYEALPKWLTLSQQELETYGVESPQQISQRMFGIVERLSTRHTPGQLLHYVMVTHETSLAAMMQHFEPLKLRRPGYAESMKISVNPQNETTIYTFRGKNYLKHMTAPPYS